MSARGQGFAATAAVLSCLVGGCGGDLSPITEASLDPALRLVWADEFNGPPGPPDPASWTYDLGGGNHGWGNNELETYTDSTDNVRVNGNGQLEIVARKAQSPRPTCWYGPCDYTSGRITTKGRFDEVYGHVEARIQIPRGHGMWPAFWALGADIDQVPWPACGEIDVMENSGSEPAIVHGTVHGPGYFGGSALTRAVGLTGAEHFADNFHVFAVDWTPSGLTFSVDGRAYFKQIRTDSEALLEAQRHVWAFDRRFFLLLNLAVGGNFVADPPDGTTVFPQTMRVDYVRWYQKP